MIWLIYERSSGIVVGSLTGNDRPTVMNHHDVIEYSGSTVPDFGAVRIVNGLCVASVDALEIVRSRALRLINRKRQAIQVGGCATAKGVMQSDSESRLLLSGAIQMAQIALSQGQPFSMGWTMIDNVTVDHDAGELIAAGVTMGQHIARAHFTAIALKAAINDAETVGDIEAIDIEGGGWGTLS